MENINKTPTTRAMGISIFVTVVLFIFISIGVQIILPSYVFETSDYYILIILLELIPLGIGVWLYLIISGQKLSDVIVFSKPQAKMNQSKMIWLILLGAGMAIVGNIFLKTVQLGWLSFLEALGYKISDASFPPIDSFKVFIYATLGVAVTPAIMEELIFRGIAQKGLLRNTKPKTAIIVSSILFMLMHVSVENMAFTLVAGLILGYMAYKCGSIVPSMAFHFVNNFIAVGTLYLVELSNSLYFATGAETLEYEAIAIFVTLIMAAFSLGLLILALWGFSKISKSPPKNPFVKPMKPATLILLVLSACILFLVMAVFAIIQNVVIM